MFSFQTGSSGKVQPTLGEIREERTILEKGCLVLLPLETLQEQRIKYFTLHILLHAVELFLGQGIYSIQERYLSWTGSFIAEQVQNLPVRTSFVSDFSPLV